MKEPSIEIMSEIEPQVLDSLNIKTEEQFESTLKTLIDSYYIATDIKLI